MFLKKIKVQHVVAQQSVKEEKKIAYPFYFEKD